MATDHSPAKPAQNEALGNVTPAYVYYGERDAILACGEKVKHQRIASTKAVNIVIT